MLCQLISVSASACSHPAAKLNIYLHVISKELLALSGSSAHRGRLYLSLRKSIIKTQANEGKWKISALVPSATAQHFKTNCRGRTNAGSTVSSCLLALRWLVSSSHQRLRSQTENKTRSLWEEAYKLSHMQLWEHSAINVLERNWYKPSDKHSSDFNRKTWVKLKFLSNII